MHQIFNILKAEIQALTELLDTLRRQQQAILHSRLEGFSDFISQEESLISRLQALEKRRLSVMENQNPEPMTEHATLSEARDKMCDLVDQVQKVNRQNNTLVNRSLSMIHRHLDLLIGVESDTESYSGTGRPVTATRRQLLNARV